VIEIYISCMFVNHAFWIPASMRVEICEISHRCVNLFHEVSVWWVSLRWRFEALVLCILGISGSYLSIVSCSLRAGEMQRRQHTKKRSWIVVHLKEGRFGNMSILYPASAHCYLNFANLLLLSGFLLCSWFSFFSEASQFKSSCQVTMELIYLILPLFH